MFKVKVMSFTGGVYGFVLAVWTETCELLFEEISVFYITMSIVIGNLWSSINSCNLSVGDWMWHIPVE